jgi:hypothetical protein
MECFGHSLSSEFGRNLGAEDPVLPEDNAEQEERLKEMEEKLRGEMEEILRVGTEED